MARTVETWCQVSVSETVENLYAHVELEEFLDLAPGDQVTVHGQPIPTGPGQVTEERRRVTIVRASWIARVWARFLSNFELLELFEVSFTDRRKL
ncbi:MAG: hypothetical protein IPG45_31875 [Deltaproteobacteria bacterium]|jgi:hypothetical protein|nr:hypothetical protein [Deltaproteobacteria bacterium]